jgi:NADH:ubiquinone oxidoreductase subunit C
MDCLKNNYSFNILKSITAVDLGDKIELLYHLFSVEDEEDAVISIKVQNEAESVSDLFDSAKADENEIYDMFGVRFTGNEDLKRLYMSENWEGYPLRKDYVQDDTRLAWNEDDSNNA